MSQVVPDAIERYITALHHDVDAVTASIGGEGRAEGLPLLNPASARLLRTLVAGLGAGRVLEIGTAIGYSAVCMASAMPAGGSLITIELDPARAARARANFERAGLASRISLVTGDATRYLHKLAGPFDLIFQDSQKTLYSPMLDRLVELLRPGGMLVSDNVLWGGEVVDGYVAAPKHDPADTAAVREYNDRLAADRRLLTTFVPIGDGLAISVKLPS